MDFNLKKFFRTQYLLESLENEEMSDDEKELWFGDGDVPKTKNIQGDNLESVLRNNINVLDMDPEYFEEMITMYINDKDSYTSDDDEYAGATDDEIIDDFKDYVDGVEGELRADFYDDGSGFDVEM